MTRLSGVTLACALGSALVSASGSIQSKDIQAVGVLPIADLTVDISKSDFTRLGIADRSAVTVSGTAYQVYVIERDEADPIIKLHLKLGR